MDGAQIDVRAAYILGTNFENRMFDIYEGMQISERRPPYMDDLFIQNVGIEAALLLEQNKHLYRDNLREWNELFNQVWEDDSMAKFEVLEKFSITDVVSDVMKDVILYVNQNCLSYLVRQSQSQSSFHAKLYHAPFREIW